IMTRILRLLACVITVSIISASIAVPAGTAPKPKFVFAWGKKGSKPGEFHSPIGIAISKQDEVFVTDLNNARVQKFSAEGKYLGGFDLPWDAHDERARRNHGAKIDCQAHPDRGSRQQAEAD